MLQKKRMDSVFRLKFHRVKLNHDFIIRIKMLGLQDGTWEVVSIENLKEYLKEFTSS